MKFNLFLFYIFLFGMLRAGNPDSAYIRIYFHNDFLLFDIAKANGFTSDKQFLSFSNSINVNFLNSRHFVLSSGFTLYSLNFLNSDYLDYINMDVVQTRYKSSYWGPTIGFMYYSLYGHLGFYTSLRFTGFTIPDKYLDEYDSPFHLNGSVGAGSYYSAGKWYIGIGISRGGYCISKLNNYKYATGISTLIGWRFL